MSQDSIAPEIEEKLKSAIQWIPTLREEIARVIVGQHYLVDRLLVGLLANGHVLLEGVPGLAKTLSIRTLASATAAQCGATAETSRTERKTSRAVVAAPFFFEGLPFV